VRKFVLLLLVLTACALPAFAQHDTDAYFGFAHETGDVAKNGWNLSGSYGFADIISGEADFGGYYGSHQHSGNSNNTHTFVFGPNIHKPYRKQHFAPFGHILFGFAHNHDGDRGGDQGSTAFAYMLGVGTDFNFNSGWAARAKVDLVHTHFFNDGQTNLRVGIGVAYHFGK